jgi:hypothetical protein
LKNAKKLGFVSGREGEYSVTDAGEKKRFELRHPQVSLLKKEIGFFKPAWLNKYITKLFKSYR